MTSRPAPLALAAVFALVACSGGADRPAAPPAAPPAAAEPTDLEGSWTFCSGAGDFDGSVTFEGGEARTYLHDRPGVWGTFSLDGDAFEWTSGPSAGGRNRVERAGDVLAVHAVFDGEVADVGTVYARYGAACP